MIGSNTAGVANDAVDLAAAGARRLRRAPDLVARCQAAAASRAAPRPWSAPVTRGSQTVAVPPVSIISCVNAFSPNSGWITRISAEWCCMREPLRTAGAHVEHPARVDAVDPALVVDVAGVGDEHLEAFVRLLVAVGLVRHRMAAADVAEPHRRGGDRRLLDRGRIVAVLVRIDAAGRIGLRMPGAVAEAVAAVDDPLVVRRGRAGAEDRRVDDAEDRARAGVGVGVPPTVTVTSSTARCCRTRSRAHPGDSRCRRAPVVDQAGVP